MFKHPTFRKYPFLGTYPVRTGYVARNLDLFVKSSSCKRPDDNFDQAPERCHERQVCWEKASGPHEARVRQQHSNNPNGQPGV